MESKTILVTGGSGYIGGMVCRLLADAGHNVINIDRVKKEIPGVTLYPFDLDNHQIKGLIKLIKPDTIIHLAADKGVRRSMSEPSTYYGNNVVNTINLLNHAVEFGVKNFIFSSSSTVYGDCATSPIDESQPLNPINPYGRSKAIIEGILDDYKRVYDLNFVALRYFNVAGAAPDLSHGYTDTPAANIMPILARHVVRGTPVELFGDDYNSADGTAIRNYTHLYDIATAHIAAMNYLADGGDSGAFNIGGDESCTNLELFKKFEEVSGTAINYTTVTRNEGEAVQNCASTKKAQLKLGWKPKYNLTDIITHALEWEKKTHKVK